MDIFKISAKSRKRAFKKTRSRDRKSPWSEMYIRMVIPAEQTTAIAKSMLERQSYGTLPKFDRMKQVQKPVKRKSSGGTSGKKGSKKSKKETSSSGENTSLNSDIITTIGPILK